MRSLWAVWLAAGMLPLLACRAFETDARHSDDHDPPDDGGVPAADAGVPVADAGPRCNPAAPFRSPVRVHLEDHPELPRPTFRLTANETQAYYVVAGRLHFADRISDTEFGRGYAVAVLQPDGGTPSPFSPSLSEDGSTLYFDLGYRLWRAVAAEPGGPYLNADFVAPDNLLAEPFFDETDGFVYASRFRAGGSLERDVVRAPLHADGGLGEFEAIALGEGTSHNPVPVQGGASLFFSSTRPGSVGPDVYHGEPGAAVERVTRVNSAGSDLPTWLSRDGCHLYIASTRNLQTAGFAIYLSVREE